MYCVKYNQQHKSTQIPTTPTCIATYINLTAATATTLTTKQLVKDWEETYKITKTTINKYKNNNNNNTVIIIKIESDHNDDHHDHHYY